MNNQEYAYTPASEQALQEMDTFDAAAYIMEPRWQKVRLGLERTQLLMEKLGNPQDKLRFVHVAGTNGKGSVCAYVANILQCAGYKTGLFTSPHLVQFEERMQINGQLIPHDQLTRITLAVREQAEALFEETGDHPTEFELMTAVGLCYFAQEQCDIVVMEVGLGGTYDSTNIIKTTEVAVIARIGLDHTDMLGNTLAQIAGEKAGIIKKGASVVSYPQEFEADEVIYDAALEVEEVAQKPNFDVLEVGDVIMQVDEDGHEQLVRTFSYGMLRNLFTTMLGEYQPYNAAVAIAVANALIGRGWTITAENVFYGLGQAHWPGRFEVLPRQAGEPWCVLDGGHNPQGIEALVDSVSDVFPDKQPIVVLSVLADKDYGTMTDMLVGMAKAFVTVTPPNLRALPSDELANVLREKCEAAGRADVPVVAAQSFAEAHAHAYELASEDDVIVVSGSLYSLADAKEAFDPDFA